MNNKDLCDKCGINHRPRTGCGGRFKHDPRCDCGICAYCNGREDVYGNPIGQLREMAESVAGTG